MNTEFAFIRHVAQSFDQIHGLKSQPGEAELCRHIFQREFSHYGENSEIGEAVGIIAGIPDIYSEICKWSVESTYDWFLMSGQLSFHKEGSPNSAAIRDTATTLLNKLGQVRDQDEYSTAEKQLTDYIFQTVYTHNDRISARIVSKAHAIRGEWTVLDKGQVLLYKAGRQFASAVNSELFKNIVYWAIAIVVGATALNIIGFAYNCMIPAVASTCFHAFPVTIQSLVTLDTNILYKQFRLLPITGILTLFAAVNINSIASRYFPSARGVTSTILNATTSVCYYPIMLFLIIPSIMSRALGRYANMWQANLSNSMKTVAESRIDNAYKEQYEKAWEVWCLVTKNARSNGLKWQA